MSELYWKGLEDFIMKKVFLIAIAFLSVGYFPVCFAENFTIVNKSGYPVYIYDWDMSASPSIKTLPITGADPLAIGAGVSLSMQRPMDSAAAGRRIYVSSNELRDSLQGDNPDMPDKPVMPDAFTPWYDGAVMFSFVEYLYDPANSRYTVNLSYIDEFSYPITIKFTGATYPGFEENFEYGFTSFAAVEGALKSQATYPWEDLVWPTDNPVSPLYSWPTGIYRIIGPNKVWTSDSFGLSHYAPNTYHYFVDKLPYNGKELFSSAYTNYNGWLYSITLPAMTGYVKALRSVATPDNNGKYGFFCYPNDNVHGEFTWVPINAQCTLTIYPYPNISPTKLHR